MIDRILNYFTMYRVMLYFLSALWFYVLILSFLNLVPFNFWEFVFSSSVTLITCLFSNKLLSKIFKVPTNIESPYITGLILTFIILPAKNLSGFEFLAAASILAMASKFVLKIHKKHIFNPAAFAVFASSLLSIGYASWWIGNKWTLIPILIGGLLVVKKIQRFSLISSFLVIFTIFTLFFASSNHSDLTKIIERLIFDSPILFFTFVMLVEPLTTPPTKIKQIFYGTLVGVLAGSQYNIGPIYSTYESALIFGNIFSFIVSTQRRLVLTLKEKIEISPEIYEFIFDNNFKNFSFSAGQYMEWTLGHRGADLRGNRRYFTIASSPSEKDLIIASKFDPIRSSTFKTALKNLPVGGKIFAGQVSGEFTLPKDKTSPLIFIAGGIGITPFRSMVKYLLDKNEKRNITLIYSNRDSADFAFKDLFDQATKIGVKTIYTLTDKENVPKNWKGSVGRVSMEIISKIPDYKKALYYLSGPHAMVEGFDKTIRDAGISGKQIKKDFFPGYA